MMGLAKKYDSKEHYTIEMLDGIKVIRLGEYVYNAGQGIMDQNKTYRSVSINKAIPVSDIAGLSRDELDELIRISYETCTQTISDLTEEEAEELLEAFYEAHDPDLQGCSYHYRGQELSLESVTLDTPCGEYIDYTSEEKEGCKMVSCRVKEISYGTVNVWVPENADEEYIYNKACETVQNGNAQWNKTEVVMQEVER